MDDDSSRAADRPDSIKKLRACRTCKLLKTRDQFYTGFCDNCPHKRPEGDTPGEREDYVATETTDDFLGMVAMMDPRTSWAARWLHMQYVDDDGKLQYLKPGVYALRLPADEEEQVDAAEEGDGDEPEPEDADYEPPQPATAAAAPAIGDANRDAARGADAPAGGTDEAALSDDDDYEEGGGADGDEDEDEDASGDEDDVGGDDDDDEDDDDGAEAEATDGAALRRTEQNGADAALSSDAVPAEPSADAADVPMDEA